MKKAWTRIHSYLAGMDDWMPTEGKSETYKGYARRLEVAVERQNIALGKIQRVKEIKS